MAQPTKEQLEARITEAQERLTYWEGPGKNFPLADREAKDADSDLEDAMARMEHLYPAP
jgi:hypothetical protein